MESKYNTGESPVLTIKLFSEEGSDNCMIVRSCGEQSCAILAGHNGNEPHLMRLETFRTRKPSLWAIDEGRRELFEVNHLKESKGLKQLATVQCSGGVSESSMLRSVFERNQETLHSEVKTSTTDTSSSNSKVCRVVQGVRVLHSSNETAVMAVERRRGTYVDAIHRRKGECDGK